MLLESWKYNSRADKLYYVMLHNSDPIDRAVESIGLKPLDC